MRSVVTVHTGATRIDAAHQVLGDQQVNACVAACCREVAVERGEGHTLPFREYQVGG